MMEYVNEKRHRKRNLSTKFIKFSGIITCDGFTDRDELSPKIVSIKFSPEIVSINFIPKIVKLSPKIVSINFSPKIVSMKFRTKFIKFSGIITRDGFIDRDELSPKTMSIKIE